MNRERINELERQAEQFFLRVVSVSAAIAALCITGFLIAWG